MARKPVALTIVCALALLAIAAPAGATFAGRNGLVAYGAEDGVHVMRPDGTRDRIVSRQGPASAAEWGPHGNRIAFSARGRIFVANLRTGKTQSFTASSTDFQPTWSSHGGRIAFVRRREGSEGVWYVRLSDRLKDLLIPGDVSDAEYAPDGSSIAYTLDGDVYLAKPNGRGSHKLVDFPEGEGQPLAGSLSWAPDASELAFHTTADVAACDDCELLWTVDSDGSDLHEVTSRFRDLGFPFWAPDGGSISFCEFFDLQSVERQQALVHHGEHNVGATCGESWQARP